MSFTFTEITNNTGKLNKTISLVDGNVVKTPSANVSDGSVQVFNCQNFTQFDTYLNGLNSNKALILGVPKHELIQASIVKKGEEELHTGKISRTNDYFWYGGNTTLLVIDYDPQGIPEHLQINKANELVEAIQILIPQIRDTEGYVRNGSSSGIRNEQGECVSCKSSMHAYFRVDHASIETIANFIDTIHENAIKHGLYFLKIHKNGAAKLQTIIDESVIKSANSRIIYEAAPTLLNGLTRDANTGFFFNEGKVEPINLSKISKVTSLHLWRSAYEAEKKKQSHLIEETKRNYKVTKKAKLISEGFSEAEATVIVTKHIDTGLLSVKEFITLENGEQIRIIDAIFQNKDGRYIADPIEPEKGNNRAVLNVKNCFDANIYSYLDGGITYTFSYEIDDVNAILDRINTEKETKTILKTLKRVCVNEIFSLAHLNEISQKLATLGLDPYNSFKIQVLNATLEKKAIEAMEGYALLMSKGDVSFIHTKAFELESSSLSDLKLFFKNKQITAIDPETERLKLFCPVDVWMRSKGREEYVGIEFIPDNNNPEYPIYSLFKGFKHVPNYTLNIQPFLNFIWEVICSRDNFYYGLVITFFAQIMQQPSKKYNTALVMISGKGTGKSTLMKGMSIVFDGYYMQTADTDKIIGKFNHHIGSTLLCYANESFFIGDKKSVGKLKNFISETTMTYEIKGGAIFTGKNVARLVIDSNDENVVQQTSDERRFLYAPISHDRVGDAEYYATLYALMEDPLFGESLTHFLMTFDIKPYVHYLKFPPRNEITIEQQLQNLSDIESWWFACLQEGEILGAHYQVEIGGSIRISNQELYESFTKYTKAKGKRVFDSKENFGKAMHKAVLNDKLILNGAAKTSDNKNGKVFAPLELCQSHFIEKQKLGSYEFEQLEWQVELFPTNHVVGSFPR